MIREFQLAKLIKYVIYMYNVHLMLVYVCGCLIMYLFQFGVVYYFNSLHLPNSFVLVFS